VCAEALSGDGLDDCNFFGMDDYWRDDCSGESASNSFVECNGRVIWRYSNIATEVYGKMFLVIVVVNVFRSCAD
jgi:hypothetical protein